MDRDLSEDLESARRYWWAGLIALGFLLVGMLLVRRRRARSSQPEAAAPGPQDGSGEFSPTGGDAPVIGGPAGHTDDAGAIPTTSIEGVPAHQAS